MVSVQRWTNLPRTLRPCADAQCPAYPAHVAELTVRDLTEDPALGLAVAVTGSTLDVPVRWAHSTELLDPRPYLRGGELVLTVGAGLTGPERCIAFVNVLCSCRAAALGLGIGDVHLEPPAALVTACTESGLPLLLIPPATPFMQVTEYLADHRVRMESNRSGRSTIGRLLAAIAQRQASPDVLRDDLAQAGLTGSHLVASAWPPAIAGELERWFSSEPHLIADVDLTTLVITSDAASASVAAARLGQPHAISAPFDVDHLATAITRTLEAWAVARQRADEDPPLTVGGPAVRSSLARLVESVSEDALIPLLNELVLPIEEHDRGNSGHLLDSLRVFLQHDGSVQAAARAMHLHPNTLRHRLTRIRAITGRNPLLFRDQVDFAIALQAAQRQIASRRRTTSS